MFGEGNDPSLENRCIKGQCLSSNSSNDCVFNLYMQIVMIKKTIQLNQLPSNKITLMIKFFNSYLRKYQISEANPFSYSIAFSLN
jgi:hypothetical protein